VVLGLLILKPQMFSIRECSEIDRFSSALNNVQIFDATLQQHTPNNLKLLETYNNGYLYRQH
jgi:hypothetical protein